MKRIFNNGMFGVGVTLLLMTASCQSKIINQDEAKFAKYAVTGEDFPKGWVLVGKEWNGEAGKESYSVAYGVPNERIIGFGETIAFYPDPEQAQNAYLELEKEWFGTTKKWPGTEFIPVDPTDEYKYECLQIFSDKSIVSCSFLQNHSGIVVIINITLDGKAITLSQFNDVLRVLDERLNKIETGLNFVK